MARGQVIMLINHKKSPEEAAIDAICLSLSAHSGQVPVERVVRTRADAVALSLSIGCSGCHDTAVVSDILSAVSERVVEKLSEAFEVVAKMEAGA